MKDGFHRRWCRMIDFCVAVTVTLCVIMLTILTASLFVGLALQICLQRGWIL